MVANVWRSPFKRFGKPLWGDRQMYLPESWEPNEQADWGKALRRDIWNG